MAIGVARNLCNITVYTEVDGVVFRLISQK